MIKWRINLIITTKIVMNTHIGQKTDVKKTLKDFVEVIANYLVKSDAQWNEILRLASLPGVDSEGKELPDDRIKGELVILQKLDMAKKWLKDSWSIDLDSLRAEIIKRQLTINEVLD